MNYFEAHAIAAEAYLHLLDAGRLYHPHAIHQAAMVGASLATDADDILCMIDVFKRHELN